MEILNRLQDVIRDDAEIICAQNYRAMVKYKAMGVWLYSTCFVVNTERGFEWCSLLCKNEEASCELYLSIKYTCR